MESKPIVQLSGADGNVFSIIARCTTAARRHGWDKARVDELRSKMMSAGSYDEVLQIAMEELEVE